MTATATVVRTAFMDAAARRTAFWWQIAAMALNDVAWVAFWLIFFHQVQSVRGWDSHRVLLLFAVLTTSAGLVLGLLSNCRRIPQLIDEGTLDETLTLPVQPLRHLLVRRIDTVNLGDVLFGIVLFTIAGNPTPRRVGMYLAGSMLGAVLFASFLVLVGSLVFFMDRAEPAGLGLNAILLLASYPADIFTGATKALLYTAVPAAFVAAVPAQLIDSFSLTKLSGLVVAAVVFAFAGWLAFTLGLRRYTSGSAWTRG
jgi:ABC-2 type transport system permease protein